MVQNSKKTEALAIKEIAILLSRKDFTQTFSLLANRLCAIMISCKNIRNICKIS